MAKLILSMDGLVLKEIVINKERMTIGRKPNNDIQIDNLAISGEHAAIVTILNDSFLEDLGSTNGTVVNGQPVKKHFLRNNDLVELGKYKLKFISDPVVAGAGAADFEKTMVLRPGAVRPVESQKNLGDTHAGADIPKPQAAPAAAAAQQPQGAAIQLLNGANAGKELELTKTLTTLGKPGVQVAVIAKRPHGYFITHVEGAQFPVINGKMIDAQAHPLSDHDVIEIAGVKMEFFFKT